MQRAPIVPCTLALAVAAAAMIGACAPEQERCVARAGLEGAPATVDVVEGGRGFIALPRVAGIAVHVGGLVAGFTAKTRADGALVVSAPYGISGTLPARLEAVCDDGDRAQHPIELVVRPLTVRTVSTAEALAQGPGARTRPGLAVVEAGVVVVGGFADDEPLDDVWLLPREPAGTTGHGATAWRRVEVTLDVGAGALRAAGAGDGRVLVLGPTGALALVDVEAAAVERLASSGAVPVASAGAGLAHAASTTLALCGSSDDGRHCRASVRGDDGAWRLLSPDGFSPVGREHPVVAVDEEGRRLVLYGGDTDEGPAVDAWTLALDDIDDDVISWAHFARSASTAEPVARRGACGALDPLGHRLLVVGGASPMGALPGLLAWDLEKTGELADGERAWREVGVVDMPVGGEGCAAAWDPIEARVVVGFGTPAPNEAPSLWALDVGLDRRLDRALR